MRRNYQSSYRRRRINWKNVIILVVALAIIAVAGFFAIRFAGNLLGSIFKDPYAQYQVYNHDTKGYGSLQTDNTENEEELYYLSFHYPEFKEDYLNKAVEDYRTKQIQTDYKQTEMIYVMVDYDCEKIFDSYVTLTFHQKTVDKNDQVLNKESYSYNYDLKTQKQMSVSDVLRRNYVKMLLEKNKTAKLDEKLIDRTQLNQFMLSEDKVTFYFNQNPDQKLEVAYKGNEAYIALANAKIPSYFMAEREIPKPQPEVEAGKRMIAFTFDDGPASANTYAIMDELEKYNGRGTFFMLGQNVTYYPEVVKDVYRRGHEIATHSYTHSMGIAATGTMNAQEVSDELYNTCDEIYKVCGYEPKYFRPPYGAINDNVLNECGMDIVKWDIDSLDWENHNPQKMTDIVVNNAQTGYVVVLMHDIHDETVEGVKQCLAQLHEQGFQFVTIDTLMQHEKEYLTTFNTEPLYNVVIEGNDKV